MNKGKYYITTAIAYTSGKPHIGNTYEVVLADAIARFKRLNGYDVYFQTGTDEHGQKIEIKAKEEGMEPQKYVDKIAGEIKHIWDIMNTSYDNFIRTTDEKHMKTVQDIFDRLYEQGDIYKGFYEGHYCTPCESFFTEAQLIEGSCPDCRREVNKAKEEAYFFKLSKYSDRLMEHIENNPDFIQPDSRKNEMVNNFIKPGIQDLCVSRTSFNWGIPVTFDDKHVIYVWIDALSNYITGLDFNIDGNQGELFMKYWPADVHLIGKDILRFHTLYWPIMLMALGVELPRQIFGHPWLLVGEGKMSKSKGNVLYADDLVKYFGVDAVRYFLLHEMPFANDGTITYELLIERVNSDLVNILSNLVNRTIAMVNQYFAGEIKSPDLVEDIDKDLIELALATPKKVEEKMNSLKVSDAIDEIFVLLRRTNKYIDETFPWILGKDNSKHGRLSTVLYNLLESIRISAVLLHSFLPETAEKIFRQINTENLGWESIQNFGGIIPGTKVENAEIIFSRIDSKKKIAEILNSVQDSLPEEIIKEDITQISIEDFSKIDLRVAKIIECKPHPDADKLLVLKLKVGKVERQVVSGISNWYKPEDLVGRKVVMVYNLKPVKLRGVISEGMILAAGKNKMLSLVSILEDIEDGSKIS